MIITIDGPAGTGKPTGAREVGSPLRCVFLETRAMYGAAGLAARRRGIDLRDQRELIFAAKHARLTFDWSARPPTLSLNGEVVSQFLRGLDATRAASFVAAVPANRARLVAEQRQIGAERKNLVTEGRDQGSVVF